jgi:hypothetical protein
MRSSASVGAVLQALAVVFCTAAVTGCAPPSPDEELVGEEIGVVQAGISSATGTVGGKPVWAHFSNPPAFGGRDYTITEELKRLINSTPAGGTIRGTIHSISIDGVADALLAAQTRGVSVSLVLDGKNATSTDPAVATIRKITNA